MSNEIETLWAELESDLARVQQDMDAYTRRAERGLVKILRLERE